MDNINDEEEEDGEENYQAMGHEEEADKALYIDVNISEGRQVRIVVNESDRAEKVAADFA